MGKGMGGGGAGQACYWGRKNPLYGDAMGVDTVSTTATSIRGHFFN